MFRDWLTIPRLIAISFLALIALGTLLLLLPICRASGAAPMSVVDSIFMATSATCITGLASRDPARDFSFAGQLVLLILCQTGALGILTISNYLLFVWGRRLGINNREVIESIHGGLPQLHPATLVRQIVIYTFTIEALGAGLLAARFAHEFPLHKALWYGVFYSVASFCNAGFSLFPDSLIRYQNDIWMKGIVMGLIIMGGLGFVVFADLQLLVRARLRRERHRLSLHTRVVLVFSAVLTLSGALLFTWLETSNPVRSEQPLTHSALHMLFLSVTARSAGFNSIDITTLTNSSLLLLMFLMMVGGSPGSTAGGVKTTTLAVFYALVRSRLKARPAVELIDRTLPLEVIGKAVATLVAFIVMVFVAVLILGWTELGNAPNAAVHAQFLDQFFEIVSATGTVGLSMGITPHLSGTGKLVVAFCMFFGRLGPLIIGASLVGRKQPVPYNLPNEQLMIG